MNLCHKNITEVINQWDPVGLLAMHCPADEYAGEIAEIVAWCDTHVFDKQQLGAAIYEIFCRCFGRDVFMKSLEECVQVAERICMKNGQPPNIAMACTYSEKLDKERILQMDIIALLDTECDFRIQVHGRTFYEQPLFPILEFLHCYLEWDQKHDFIYNTLESEERPMLAFQKQITGWRLDSVWKKFDCTTSFQLSDFTNAVEQLFLL